MTGAFHKLLALLTQRDRLHLYVLVASLVLMAAVELAGIASIMPFMAVVTNPAVVESNRWLEGLYEGLAFANEHDFLIFLGVMVLALLVFSNVIKAASSWLALRYHNRLYYTLARRLLAQYMARPYAYFLNHNTAELGKNILAEVSTVVGSVLNPATQIVSSALTSLAILGLLIVVDPIVAFAIAFVLGGIYGLVYFLARKKLAVISAQQVRANFQKFKTAGEALSGIKDLKVLGRERTFLEVFGQHAERHAHNNVIAGLVADMPRYALEIVSFGGILLVTLHLLDTGRQASSMVPLLALYAFAGYRLMPALQQVFAAFTKLRFSLSSLDVLYRDLVHESGECTDAEETLRAASAMPTLPFRETLELRNVSFRYAAAAEDSLRNLNVTIPANTAVGFVGATGSGKTTAVDIILGLHTPTAGMLLADGMAITPENLPAWHKNLGYVPQQIYICDDTVTRNIAFGVPEKEIDLEAVRRAARIANLETFVDQELAEGFDTVIGEHGIRLSGGQRQRIGIARALYRDPAILVMDEATSALDGITEEAVMEAVRTLAKKKTIILIAHRLTTVKGCDAIYLLDQGAIRAHGTYDDLMRESSWFRAAASGAKSAASV